MQMKLIAAAVVGLMSSAAFAQVVVGGKFDAGYLFNHTQNADSGAGGATGGNTTEAQTDGNASTSRLTFVAKEDLGSGMSMEANLDLRFTNIHEGKTGLNNNDKKVLIFRTPIVNVLWGVSNLGGAIYFGTAEKPYMIAPKDLEIVKYGVSQLRESSLTNRNTTLFTQQFNMGAFGMMFHGTYASGDNHKSGANNNDSATIANANTGSGDVKALGTEMKVGNIVNWGIDVNHRDATSFSAAGKNDMHFSHMYVNVKPVAGLKFAGSWNQYRGYNGTNAAYKEKNINLVAAYNLNDKLEVGVERSHLNDYAASRNSGKGFMVGAAYFLSKNTYAYVSHAKTDFDRNETGLAGKYDGTAAGFTNTLNKQDSHITKIGMVKEF